MIRKSRPTVSQFYLFFFILQTMYPSLSTQGQTAPRPVAPPCPEVPAAISKGMGHTSGEERAKGCRMGSQGRGQLWP